MTHKFLSTNALFLASLALCACGESSETPECTNNQRQCSTDGIPQYCMNGRWISQNSCAPAQICQDGVCQAKPCTDESCMPKPECTDRDLRCLTDTQPQACVSGHWSDLAPCSAAQQCASGICQTKPCTDASCMPKPECSASESRCGANNTPQICISGKWSDTTPCSANQTCQNGACKDNAPTCSEAECKSASIYRGNACIEKNDKQICGCASDKDCMTGYACDKDKNVCEIKCSDKNCAAQTSGYSGNICITETEEDITYSYCGCKEDTDCKSGYSCDTVLGTCQADCVDAECAAMNYSYAGDICMAHYLDDGSDDFYITCGCKSDKDCRDGYTCNLEFNFCAEKGSDSGSCKPDACKAKLGENYHGDACVILSKGIDCGCETDDDCRGEYICNYMNQCIIEEDISECETNDDCRLKSTKDYYGDQCLVDYYADKSYTFCGCKNNRDCKTGYSCDISQETCMPD